MLLKTRQAVLATRYTVLPVRSLEEMVKLPTSPKFDVVLLCHTLTSVECIQAAETARRRWPEARVVTLTSASGSCAQANSDLDVYSLDGPAVLLEAIQDLVIRRESSGFSASM